MENKPLLIKEILFFRTDRIGDFLVSLPTIEILRQKFPEASITVVLNPLVKELVEGHASISKYISFSTLRPPSFKAWIKLFWTLKKTSYDLAVISNPHKYFHLLTWILRIPIRIGYDRKWKWFLNHRYKEKEVSHQVLAGAELLSTFLETSPALPLVSLPISDKDRQRLPQKPFLVLAPFSTHKAKEWPLSHYITLAQKFSEQQKYSVIFIGGPEDEKNLHSTPLPPQVLNLCGKLSLKEVAALLEKAELLISNDNGPVHIAACVKTPTLVLYGQQDKGSSPERWGAHWNGGNSHRVMVKKFISDITIDNVWKMANEQLS